MSDAPPLAWDHLAALPSVGFAILATDGRVLRANDLFARLASAPDAPGEAPWSARRHFVAPDFARLAAAAERAPPSKVVHEGLLNLGPPDGAARTVRGIVVALADARLAVLVQEEPRDVEALAREVLALNEDLSEAHREQARVVAQLRRTEAELREALAQVRTLKGLLPLCADCKRIRNDEGRWERLESYIERRTEAQVSHGICEACLERELGALDGPPP